MLFFSAYNNAMRFFYPFVVEWLNKFFLYFSATRNPATDDVLVGLGKYEMQAKQVGNDVSWLFSCQSFF